MRNIAFSRLTNSVEPSPLPGPVPIGAATTPRVSVNSPHEPGPQRVAMDVSDQFKEIPLRLHDYGFVASSEQGPSAPVCTIEALRVHPIHVPHKPREIRIRSLHQKMIMVRHQAECRYADIPHDRPVLQHLQKTEIILATKEDGFTPPSPVHHMIPGVGILYSQRTRDVASPPSAITRIDKWCKTS